MSTDVIQAQGLTKRYQGRTAVDGVSFAVGQGEVFGLLGPNGAGKTTTILMLLGLTDASSGSVSVLGRDPRRSPLAVKREVGYMPDAVGFYDYLTARENLAYTAKLMEIEAGERNARIDAALERVGLAGDADRRVAAFSRGMRQRLGLAEIVLKRARIAILDEPTSGLDPQAAEDFLGLIDSLRRDGVTVLLSSHLLDHMQRICDRVALFHRGRIALMGSVPELARQVLGGRSAVLVEARGRDLPALLRGIAGVTSVEAQGDQRWRLRAERDVRPDIARALVAANAELLRLDDEPLSLDAIYNRFFHSMAQGERRHAA
ncbi:ABC transporter ATP-binding protein [Pigmentiphaga sp. NML080357]|uniref:ABC transporter ATP-binding protein n=1 Tax=Pigmentiphaga sp. NML080357 TaxID=2008675 RepID=UPI000B422861|nr:ABC transporter ATP-binding protein [Pigmentiphaga sp. NML080357]OVZ59301.1 ABC transporter ATP-binding protein [Pigmentiphaga sp. NML080357]